MSDIDVQKYLRDLKQALPRVPPIPVQELKSLHKTRDFEGMVRLIKRTMNVEVRLVIGWVNSGGPKGMEEAPAWVQTPVKMPYYGTNDFKKLTVKMFLRKSFLEQSTYEQAAIAVAHELSHIVLDSIQHPLRKEEKAVDLTAMLLGFSRLYELGAHTEDFGRRHQLGYLSPRELRLANQVLNPLHWRAIRKAKEFLGLILLVGGVLAFGWAISLLSKSP